MPTFQPNMKASFFRKTTTTNGTYWFKNFLDISKFSLFLHVSFVLHSYYETVAKKAFVDIKYSISLSSRDKKN